MKKTDNQIDEMLKLKLLKTEQTALIIAIAGLILVSIIEIITTLSLKLALGEIAVAFIVCVYIIASCLKNGIWNERKTAPTTKGNLLTSLVPTLFIAAVIIIIIALNPGLVTPKKIAILSSLVPFVFVLTFTLLEISRKMYIAKRKKLDNEPEESE